MDLFPAMAKAHCRTLMFGIESGSQKILDRLKKEQTLEQTAIAVRAAKKAGIEIVHGFFVVGNPDETEVDMCDTFRFAERLPLDTFAFNRLCVYRGTPLWKEYVDRGLVSDTDDWYKYFKCSSIDPTVLPGEKIHEIRSRELKRLIIYKFLHFPLQALRLTARLARNMPWRNVVLVFVKPFLGKKSGQTNAEVLSRVVEREAAMSAAADLTQIPDAGSTAVAERG
jgi:anaerobic magnesium-protoporphyrin IX monomethyl ester cyclase